MQSLCVASSPNQAENEREGSSLRVQLQFKCLIGRHRSVSGNKLGPCVRSKYGCTTIWQYPHAVTTDVPCDRIVSVRHSPSWHELEFWFYSSGRSDPRLTWTSCKACVCPSGPFIFSLDVPSHEGYPGIPAGLNRPHASVGGVRNTILTFNLSSHSFADCRSARSHLTSSKG